jgi:peptidoglycan hydrolase-like protein with peptidoglycan-binding domain
VGTFRLSSTGFSLCLQVCQAILSPPRLASLAAASLLLAWGQTSNPPKAPASKTAPRKPASSKPAPKAAASAKPRPTKTKPASSSAAAKAKTPARYRRARQLQPTPQRYREIQQALADRGYFRGAVDGNWGPDSIDALKRFQREQNLTDDGKIGSLSLIALGLGPPNGVLPAPTSPPAPRQ